MAETAQGALTKPAGSPQVKSKSLSSANHSLNPIGFPSSVSRDTRKPWGQIDLPPAYIPSSNTHTPSTSASVSMNLGLGSSRTLPSHGGAFPTLSNLSAVRPSASSTPPRDSSTRRPFERPALATLSPSAPTRKPSSGQLGPTITPSRVVSGDSSSTRKRITLVHIQWIPWSLFSSGLSDILPLVMRGPHQILTPHQWRHLRLRHRLLLSSSSRKSDSKLVTNQSVVSSTFSRRRPQAKLSYKRRQTLCFGGLRKRSVSALRPRLKLLSCLVVLGEANHSLAVVGSEQLTQRRDLRELVLAMPLALLLHHWLKSGASRTNPLNS